jgi:hypothetical protein
MEFRENAGDSSAVENVGAPTFKVLLEGCSNVVSN